MGLLLVDYGMVQPLPILLGKVPDEPLRASLEVLHPIHNGQRGDHSMTLTL